MELRNTGGRAGLTAAVVLNFGTAPESLRAIRSLRASLRRVDPIILVDNAASTESRQALRVAGAEVTYRPAETNLGFPGGVNVGIREALARGAVRVLLLNSDATVEPDTLEHLEAALDADESLGIVGPVILDRSSPSRVSSRGIRYNAANGRMGEIGYGDPAARIPESGVEIADAVSGCAMLIDRRVFDAVGLFDEAYFFSFEDIDFCLRGRRSGFRTGVVLAARALHDGSRTIGQQSPRRLYYAARNHLRLAERVSEAGSPVRAWSRRLAIVGFNAAHAMRASPRALPARLRATASGIRDYGRGRFGAAGSGL